MLSEQVRLRAQEVSLRARVRPRDRDRGFSGKVQLFLIERSSSWISAAGARSVSPPGIAEKIPTRAVAVRRERIANLDFREIRGKGKKNREGKPQASVLLLPIPSPPRPLVGARFHRLRVRYRTARSK